MRIDKLASAGLVAMVALGVNLQPANAYDPNQAMIDNNMETGFANYENQISTGINSGHITPAEAAQLRGELNDIMSMRNLYAAGGYSQNEVSSLLNSFNNLNAHISSAVNNSATNVAGNGYWGGNYGGPYGSNYNGNSRLGYHPNFDYSFNNYSQLTNWRNGLSMRIERARQRGVISPGEAVAMRNEYNNIISRMNQRQMNGNYGRGNWLVRRLESLDQRLNNAIAARGGNRFF